MHGRALRYKSHQAALNYIQGRLLLQYGITDLALKAELSQISCHDNGKPSLPNIEFNISHSQDIALCAFSSVGSVGIDTESLRPLNFDHLQHNFTNPEWTAIQADTEFPNLFFQLWCRKESIIKASGKTLSDLHKIHLDSFSDQFTIDNHTYHLQNIDLPFNNFTALCTQHPVASIHLIPCQFDILDGAC